MTSSATSLTSLNAGRPGGTAGLGLPDIAFVGKAGAGKSTAADLLTELGYRKLSFAGPLKDIAAQLWGEEARTDRAKLQGLGVAVREIHSDTWVDLLVGKKQYESSYSSIGVAEPPSAFVVDDLRFENEWFALKGEGFVLVRIEAPRSFRIDRLKGNGKWQDESDLDHVSETAVDHLKADYTIENDGTTMCLYDELVEVILRERKRR